MNPPVTGEPQRADHRTTAFPDTPVEEFSLVQGGPHFQLLLRAGLVRPSMDLVVRRIVAVAAVAWLPLLLLSLLSGRVFRGTGLPFLYDLGAHVRLLLCVPLFIAAEVVVHRRIRVTVQQFIDRGIVAPEDLPRFHGLIASAMRLRNSVVAELVVLAVAVGGGYSLVQRYVTMQIPTWYSIPTGDQTRVTAAGYWYFFVSLAIFRFLWFRWYFRLFVWYRFLWQVSRQIPLRLNALHPDRTGGLGFLSGSVFAFTPVLVAHTVALSGVLGAKIWHEGAKLPQFKMEIVAWMACLVVLIVVPLFFFVSHLANAKRTGLREYGIVGSRYVAEFRRKWIEGHAAKDEALIGTADIQTLADLSNSFEAVQQMSVVPFSKAAIMRLAMMTALPFAPLLLTMIPLEQLIDRALKVFM